MSKTFVSLLSGHTSYVAICTHLHFLMFHLFLPFMFGILNFNEFSPFVLYNRSNPLTFYYFSFVEWFARMLHIWEFVC
jgi:hypothetical protein